MCGCACVCVCVCVCVCDTGVGPRTAEKLEAANIDTAVKLMGNFMVGILATR